jgi:hypothetical protein
MPSTTAGSVTFYNGSASLGTVTLTAGTATLTQSFTTAGTFTLSATYDGSSSYSVSQSATVTLVVNQASTGSAASAASLVYVVQRVSTGTDLVLAFAAGGNGSMTPVSTLTPPTGFHIGALTTDNSGQIYVGGSLASGLAVIEVYAAGASGTATPLKTITMADGYPPTAIAVSNSIYTVDGDGVLAVYPSTASGTTAPSRTISGALTGLAYPGALAVDSMGDAYVAEYPVGSALPSILIFSSTASGNVAPTRTITTAAGTFVGVALDSSGNLFATIDITASPYGSSIVEYSSTASGTATPTRSVSGSNTGLITAGDLAIDGLGNIYVPNQIPAGTAVSYSLETFSATASGNAAPTASFTSSAWTVGGSEIAIK